MYPLQDRQQDALFANVMDITDVMLVYLDPDFNFVWVNKAYADTCRMTPEQMTGRNHFALYPNDENEALFRQVRDSGEPVFFKDKAFEFPDQQERGVTYWDWSLVADRDAQGVVSGLVLSLRETTAHVSAQSEARERAMQLQLIFANVHDVIFVVGVEPDERYRFLSVNQRFEEATGVPQHEVVGRYVEQVIPRAAHEQVFAKYRQAIRERKTVHWEEVSVYPSGEKIGEVSLSPVFDAAGNCIQLIGAVHDITARVLSAREMQKMALQDPLTGMPNRRLLLDRMQSAMASSLRNRHFGAVLFIDLDRFKMLNDTLGHDHGDLLLIEAASRIKQCIREIDTVARVGGDEFVVMLEDVGKNIEAASQKTASIAEKIRVALALPYLLREHLQHSTPSIGVSLFSGNEASINTVLKYADIAMYQAKESGRNAIRFFDYAMQQAVEARAALESDLQQALHAGQFQLYYQIQVDASRRPTGAEALIRWLHPVRGFVSPAQFIPLAEESSRIVDIGDWVLDTACRQLSAWSNSETTRHLTLAVNVSARQFKQPDFVGKVSAALAAHRVDPQRLKLELTESVVLVDIADVVGKMNELRALRIRLSMDDFGTGYSSLSYLKRMPLDQLKIDQSFVRDMTTDQNDAVMVRTIIDMAKNFNLDVIAEGVETEVQFATLSGMGCAAYQGYLFGKPLPVDQFEAQLA